MAEQSTFGGRLGSLLGRPPVVSTLIGRGAVVVLGLMALAVPWATMGDSYYVNAVKTQPPIKPSPVKAGLKETGAAAAEEKE